MGSVCVPDKSTCLDSLQKAINEFGSIHDVPEEDACRLFWKFWEADEMVDDLLFFVSQREPGQEKPVLQVCRHTSKQRPEINVKVDWNATLALNIICHTSYLLRVSVCTYFEDKKTSMYHLVVSEEVILPIYAGPIEGGFSQEDNCSTPSYPHLYFSVDNFETCFKNIRIAPDHVLIVELVTSRAASLAGKTIKGSFYKKFVDEPDCLILFQGAIAYDALVDAASTDNSDGFVLMHGPDGTGEAQIHALLNNTKTHSTKHRIKRFIKDVLKGSDVQKKPPKKHDFECRLTFVRMHWLDIFIKLTSKKQ